MRDERLYATVAQVVFGIAVNLASAYIFELTLIRDILQLLISLVLAIMYIYVAVYIQRYLNTQ
jgi:hypothetical protein